MKLWITGAQGFLGSALVKLCQTRTIPFIAAKKEEADVTNLDHLRQFVKQALDVTHVINCAAFTDLDAAEKTPHLAFLVNALGAENIARVSQETSIKVIHISTDYVFDGHLNRPYIESDPCHPINVYAQTKWEGEKKVLEINPSVCLIRTSWLFGQGGKNFISSVFQKMQQELSIKVVSDQRGRPTFVQDLAEAILDLLDHSGIYHFANQGEVSRFEIAEEIRKRAMSLNIPLRCERVIPISSDDFPTPARRPFYSVLSTQKVESVLKQPPRAWTHALTEYLCAIKTS